MKALDEDNLILNLINHQPNIGKTYLYGKGAFDAKYQLLINKRKSAGLKHYNNSKAFIEYSYDMDDIYENVAWDYILADIFSNKKLNSVVTELLPRVRKVKISPIFIIQSYFAFPKNISYLYPLLYHENSKQMRASTNRN